MPAIHNRSVLLDDVMWLKVRTVAAMSGESASDFIRRSLTRSLAASAGGDPVVGAAFVALEEQAG